MFYYGEGNGLLRYRLQEGEHLDDFTWALLRQNPPPGVPVPGRETTEEGDDLLLPVADCLQLKEAAKRYSGQIKGELLLETIVSRKQKLIQHMVPEQEIVLRPEYTYINKETLQPVLLVLPVAGAEKLSLCWEDYALLVRAYFAGQEGDAPAEPDPEEPLFEGETFLEKLQLFWRKLGLEDGN